MIIHKEYEAAPFTRAVPVLFLAYWHHCHAPKHKEKPTGLDNIQSDEGSANSVI